MMKSIFSKKLFLGLALMAGVFTLQSCLDDDNDEYSKLIPNALVTVKQTDSNLYLQLDDNTVLSPTNLKAPIFGGKEVRALVNYEEAEGDITSSRANPVYVNWIDSILTKPMATDLGEAENEEVYGDDALEILNDWVTVVEDGYLTLRILFHHSGGKPHFINLLSTNNPDNPYEVELRHNAYDCNVGYGQTYNSIVAFHLDQLPDTQGKTVKLTLKWNSFTGPKSVQFDYCSRKE